MDNIDPRTIRGLICLADDIDHGRARLVTTKDMTREEFSAWFDSLYEGHD